MIKSMKVMMIPAKNNGIGDDDDGNDVDGDRRRRRD
jgi:hypothetical protein